jgi:hypothetical protein
MNMNLYFGNSEAKEFSLRKHFPAQAWGDRLGGNDRCLFSESSVQGIIPWILGVLPKPIDQVSIGKKAGQ